MNTHDLTRDERLEKLEGIERILRSWEIVGVEFTVTRTSCNYCSIDAKRSRRAENWEWGIVFVNNIPLVGSSCEDCGWSPASINGGKS